MSEDFNFDELGDFDAIKIMYQELSKIVVPMFSVFREQGLTVQEAAALTAAMIAHTMPIVPTKPQED